jgi:hypothetical protein
VKLLDRLIWVVVAVVVAAVALPAVGSSLVTFVVVMTVCYVVVLLARHYINRY